MSVYKNDNGTLTQIAGISSRTWIGSKSAYQSAIANNEIPNNTIVCITDDYDGYVVDEELDDTSINPVTNRLITNTIQNINDKLPVYVTTAFPSTNSFAKVADYPSGMTKDNCMASISKFRYSNVTDWYHTLYYFTKAQTDLNINLQLRDDGVYIFITGATQNDLLGKTLILKFEKIS